MEALAAAVLVLHLAWIIWAILGALWTRGRPWLTAFHVLSLIWGIIVEVGPWPCPLTLAEQWFEAQSWNVYPNTDMDRRLSGALSERDNLPESSGVVGHGFRRDGLRL
jgi:hypothetical protein